MPSRRNNNRHHSGNSGSRSSTVELLGSNENGMAIIFPPNARIENTKDKINDPKKKTTKKKKQKTTKTKNSQQSATTTTAIAVSILKEINTILQQRRTKKKFQQWIEKNNSTTTATTTDNSVRYIQGGRMEIFLQAKGKSSAAFDTIVGERLSTTTTTNAKELVLEYAKQQAMLDGRVNTSSSTYNFDNFALVCSYDIVDAQDPHIDLIRPNHQFGLMVSEGSTSTLVFDNQVTDQEQEQEQQQKQSNDTVQTVDQLVEHWEKMAESYESQSLPICDSNHSRKRKKRNEEEMKDNQHDLNQFKMPSALVDAMNREPNVELLLRCFGNVLLPARYLLYQMKKATSLPTGTVLSLPGSVIHASPASTSFCAVIFFSGYPAAAAPAACPATAGRVELGGAGGMIVPPEEYHPDTQYTGVVLAGHITSLLWNQPGIGFDERMYLLQRLAQHVEGSTVCGTWGHFAPGNLANFVGNIETFQRRMKSPNTKDEYITKMADSCQSMGNGKDPFSEEPEKQERRKRKKEDDKKYNDDYSDDSSTEGEGWDDRLGMTNNSSYQKMPMKETTLMDDDCNYDGPPSDLVIGRNDLHEYELVSVPDLYTLWEDDEYHVEVHRRIRDGKIVLRYPAKDNEDHEEYEGSGPNDNFCLIMMEGYELCAFDGRNGDLIDTEGELIDVYQGRGAWTSS